MSWFRSLVRRWLSSGDAAPKTVLSKEAALALAIAEAKRRSLRWDEPANVVLIQRAGRPHWAVSSNALGRGASVLVLIDDANEEIVDVKTRPR